MFKCFYSLLKIYIIFEIFLSVKSPRCSDTNSKEKFDSDFFDSEFPCSDVPKTWNLTFGGVQNREAQNRRLGMIVTSFQDLKFRGKEISPTFSYFLITNALLYHFLANLLAHNKKMSEKSVFREALSPEMTSKSFPVSCFWSRGFVPHRKWNFTFLKSLFNLFLLCLPVHCGNFIEQKNLSYTL